MTDTRCVIVTLPTYDEAQNVKALVSELLALAPQLSAAPEAVDGDAAPRPTVVQVLVADDDSPDGTWRLVQEMADKDDRVHLLHRTTNRGRGSAGREAFVLALDMGADVVIEMDADFSHRPEEIPALLRALDTADLVIGSRLIEGGSEQGRSVHRTWMTACTSFFTRTLLRLSVRDCHSGYRVYRRSALEAIDPANMTSIGPEIVPEVMARASRAGLRIVEVPIQFQERRAGESSLTFGRLLKVLAFTVGLAWRTRTTVRRTD